MQESYKFPHQTESGCIFLSTPFGCLLCSFVVEKIAPLQVYQLNLNQEKTQLLPGLLLFLK